MHLKYSVVSGLGLFYFIFIFSSLLSYLLLQIGKLAALCSLHSLFHGCYSQQEHQTSNFDLPFPGQDQRRIRIDK